MRAPNDMADMAVGGTVGVRVLPSFIVDLTPIDWRRRGEACDASGDIHFCDDETCPLEMLLGFREPNRRRWVF